MKTGYEICCYCQAIDGLHPHEQDCLYNLPAEEPAELHEAADTTLEKEIA
jgi:hypothetical protein